MPRLDIDMFDESPKVGDKVKVLGKIKSIDEDSGEVEVSYDDVSIVNKKSSDKSDNNDMNLDDQVEPNDQSLDSAMNRYFQNTQ